MGLSVARFDDLGNARAFTVWNERQIGSTLFVCITTNLHFDHPRNQMGFSNTTKMEKEKKDKGLESRRDFFKKAAKSALPILGAIALASAPSIVKAAEVELGCNWGCAGNCTGSCAGRCSYTCQNSCRGGCGGACSVSCQNTCKGSCQSSCRGYCSSMSSY